MDSMPNSLKHRAARGSQYWGIEVVVHILHIEAFESILSLKTSELTTER